MKVALYYCQVSLVRFEFKISYFLFIDDFMALQFIKKVHKKNLRLWKKLLEKLLQNIVSIIFQ